MKEYHKIDSIFERDMEGTKKLIMWKFRSPVVEYLKDNEWIFTEKIDGTNIRIYWDGYKVSIGGRTDNASIPAFLFQRLSDLFLTNEVEELFEQKFGEVEVQLFGEGYGAKIQKGGGDYKDGVDYILFDVSVGGVFLDREQVEDIAKCFNIGVVPIAPVKTIEEAIKFVQKAPVSMVGKRIRSMEGVVGTPKIRINDHRGNRVIVKIKYEDFKGEGTS